MAFLVDIEIEVLPVGPHTDGHRQGFVIAGIGPVVPQVQLVGLFDVVALEEGDIVGQQLGGVLLRQAHRSQSPCKGVAVRCRDVIHLEGAPVSGVLPEVEGVVLSPGLQDLHDTIGQLAEIAAQQDTAHPKAGVVAQQVIRRGLSRQQRGVRHQKNIVRRGGRRLLPAVGASGRETALQLLLHRG